MLFEREMQIAMADGVRLAADLYRPEQREPVPVLIGFSAFGKDVQAVGRSRLPLKLGQCLDDLSIEIAGIDFFVQHGYAVLLVSPRGISSSEGCWQGLYSLQDQADCAAAVEWATSQTWCTGKAGMLGCGTAGRIQPFVAARKPKGLSAIMPIDLVDDLYAECYPGGVLSNYYLPFTSSIPMVEAVSEAELEYPPGLLRQELRRCLQKPEIQEEPYLYRTLDTWPPRHFPFLVDILLHDSPGPFWERRSHEAIYHSIEIPMYAVSLCYEFGRSSFGAIKAFTASDCPAPRKLMLMGHPVDRHTPFDEANEEMLRWYDYWLKAKTNGIMDEPPVKLKLTGSGEWHASEQFPPAGTRHTDLFLGREGSLDEVMGEEGQDELFHQPPIFKSQFSGQLPLVKYSTRPFENETRMAGPVALTLYAALDQPDGCFVAKLWDRAPGGNRLLLSSGVLRAACRLLASGSALGEPMPDCTRPLQVEPGKTQLYSIGLNPVCHAFLPGHSLELELKACDAQSFSFTDAATIPRLFSSGLTSGALPSTLYTHYTLRHGKACPSRLSLPLWENAEGRGEGQ